MVRARPGRAGEPALDIAAAGRGLRGVRGELHRHLRKVRTPGGPAHGRSGLGHSDAHRRYFLAANDGKAFSFAFLPATIVAYLQPFGLHISGLFPFFSTPTAPAAWDGAVLDQTYPTASITATTPLLFGLTIWGAITAFRPHSIGLVRLTRIILLAAAAGTAGVLLWGYISERYMADFVPLLVIASGVGLIDIWRRLQGRGRRVREVVLAAIGVLAVYCIAVNMAIAIAPESQWNTVQLAKFESVQKSLSIQSLSSTVQQGVSLPNWAPAGQLFIAGACNSRSGGLYLSSGDTEKDVPGDLIQHSTWLPVEQGSAISNTIGFTFNRPASELTGPATLLTYGPGSLVLAPYGADQVELKVLDSGTSIGWPSATGQYFPVKPGRHYELTATTDPNLKSIVVTMGGKTIIGHYLGGDGPAVVQTTPTGLGGPTPVVSVVRHPSPKSTMSLCRSLQKQ